MQALLHHNGKIAFKTSIVLPSSPGCLHIFSCLIYTERERKKTCKLVLAPQYRNVLMYCFHTMAHTHNTNNGLFSVALPSSFLFTYWWGHVGRLRWWLKNNSRSLLSWAQQSPALQVKGHLHEHLEEDHRVFFISCHQYNFVCQSCSHIQWEITDRLIIKKVICKKEKKRLFFLNSA